MPTKIFNSFNVNSFNVNSFNVNSFHSLCVFYLSNIMWIYIILLVFVVFLFSLRPQFQYGLINSKIPKVTCNKREDIQDLVILPPAPAVPLVKH